VTSQKKTCFDKIYPNIYYRNLPELLQEFQLVTDYCVLTTVTKIGIYNLGHTNLSKKKSAKAATPISSNNTLATSKAAKATSPDVDNYVEECHETVIAPTVDIADVPNTVLDSDARLDSSGTFAHPLSGIITSTGNVASKTTSNTESASSSALKKPATSKPKKVQATDWIMILNTILMY
jgi:hypothetical protein